MSLCGNCKEVCRDAVELGCDHEDEDIILFCNSCLKDVISTNANKCPINQHFDPIICPVRSVRRQILKSSVLCPYSVQFKKRNRNQNVENAMVMDTIGYGQEEGAQVAAASDIIVDGCKWKGTLSELLNNDHLHQCSMEYDAIHIQKLRMEKMQNENESLQKIIQQQMQKIDALQAKKQLEVKTDLEAENSTQIQELFTIQQERKLLQQRLLSIIWRAPPVDTDALLVIWQSYLKLDCFDLVNGLLESQVGAVLTCKCTQV
eukprot:164611_1